MFDESTFTETQQMMVHAISQIAKEFPHSYFMERMKAGAFPDAFWKSLAEGGYLGALTTEEFGGAGFTPPDVAVMAMALAQGGLASQFLTGTLVCCDALTRFGSAGQKKAHLPKLVQGGRWAFAGMERSDGRMLDDIHTTAKADGAGFVLRGTKRYIAGAQGATHFLVTALTGGAGADRIGLFVVPADAKGITVTSKEINVRVNMDREPISANGDAFFEIKFDAVQLTADSRLSGGASGDAMLKTVFATQMLLMAATAVGWGDRIIDKAVAYANGRVIYDEPIASYQAIQHPMVLAKTDVEMAKLMVERAAQVFGETHDADLLLNYAAVAKQQATEASYAACDIGIQAHGGSGFDRDNGLITLWPLILMSRLIPLNSAVILERFAEAEYGFPKSP